MATFPRTEAQVSQLAQSVINGLNEHRDIYPSPPAAPAELRKALDAYNSARAAAIAAAAAAQQRVAEKGEVLGALVGLLKTDIRYAENTVDYNDELLQLIGWGGRGEKTPLQGPGEVRYLEIAKEGPGWIELDWKKPHGGGKVAAYQIQSRRHGAGAWRYVGMATGTEIHLTDQERGVELEYQVIAVNKAGEGGPSNLVGAVL